MLLAGGVGQYSILRRYGDFKRLHDAISYSAAQRGIMMAKFPKGGVTNFFARNSPKLVEQRTVAFQAFLETVLSHPFLYETIYTRKFLAPEA